ncbi:hypothetical protein Tco_1460390, partial [Tanacetum coccineum]
SQLSLPRMLEHYLDSLKSPPPRVSLPPPTQENASIDITLTLSPITPLDI